MSSADRSPIGKRMTGAGGCLILGVGKQNVRNISGFWGHKHPIWEGHTRDALESLVDGVKKAGGSAQAVAAACFDFIDATTKGFTASSHGDAFLKEVAEGCTKPRKGKPLEIQNLAKLILAEPNHKGVSSCLAALQSLISAGHTAVIDVKILLKREFQEAIRLGSSEDLDQGFAGIAHARTYTPPRLPERCVSTVHKAKGLECRHVMVMLCDKAAFANTAYKRRLLYVALSRPVESLTLVLCRLKPSPLFGGLGSVPS